MGAVTRSQLCYLGRGMADGTAFGVVQVVALLQLFAPPWESGNLYRTKLHLAPMVVTCDLQHLNRTQGLEGICQCVCANIQETIEDQ